MFFRQNRLLRERLQNAPNRIGAVQSWPFAAVPVVRLRGDGAKLVTAAMGRRRGSAASSFFGIESVTATIRFDTARNDPVAT